MPGEEQSVTQSVDRTVLYRNPHLLPSGRPGNPALVLGPPVGPPHQRAVLGHPVGAPDSFFPVSLVRGPWGPRLIYYTLWEGVLEHQVLPAPCLLTSPLTIWAPGSETTSSWRLVPEPISRLIQKEDEKDFPVPSSNDFIPEGLAQQRSQHSPVPGPLAIRHSD